MVKFTKDEKKLIEFAKKNFPKLLERRRKKGLYDTYYACVLSNSGNIYEGSPFISNLGSATICAERVAIANMVFYETEKAKINSILVIGPIGKGGNLTPCGLCRTIIYEFSNGKASVLCAGAYFENTQKDFNFLFKRIRKFKIKDLYPSPWSDGKWE
ncbi:hypothetical protein DRN74_04960 [Candidatus Micrarchaeota archaeon]|nr:MAG: hypothetical protein DRN74_04960 [Candidatus Micrarchaeota archaeon]